MIRYRCLTCGKIADMPDFRHLDARSYGPVWCSPVLWDPYEEPPPEPEPEVRLPRGGYF